jgi:undecaprenyl-diphosphatase
LWEQARQFVAARLDRHSALGRRLSVNVIVFVAVVWAFGGLLEEVLDNETLVRWDLKINTWFHMHATPTGLRLFDAVTLLGSFGVWSLIVLVAVWLWWRKEPLFLRGWLFTTLGGKLVETACKLAVHRSRPQYAAAYLHGHSYSFPSGHTMGSMIGYTLLVFIVVRMFNVSGAGRVALYTLSSILVLAVGFSRLYLGVHYPSDVLGGLLAGFAWFVACTAIMHIMIDRIPRKPSVRTPSER